MRVPFLDSQGGHPSMEEVFRGSPITVPVELEATLEETSLGLISRWPSLTVSLEPHRYVRRDVFEDWRPGREQN